MSLSCINVKSKEFLDLQKKSGLYTHELEFMVARWQEINNQLDIFPNLSQLQPEVFYSKVTNSSEGIIASEKTIRDLAARIADRIGMKVVFESDRSKEYKGKIENNVAYVNLAYATLDTPIHEILGHPIIRAIKNKGISKLSGTSKTDFTNLKGFTLTLDSKTDEWIVKYSTSGYDNDEIIVGNTGLFGFKNQKNAVKILQEYSSGNRQVSFDKTDLYQNLLKELETGKGKEVLDRIKRDYVNKEKSKSKNYNLIDKNNNSEIEIIQNFGNYWFKEYNETLTRGKQFNSNEELESLINKEQNKHLLGKYTLEEQQEEAIVELLGLMTAEKLDKVKDGKLISLLKRLLKEMKQFVRSLLSQREVEIDKLPDNMTLGDIADLLAYSNSKLILPGNEVIYTTPDNQQFKTYQEASNHISELAKSVKDVDLSNTQLPIRKKVEKANDIPVDKFTDEFDNTIYNRKEGKWFIEDTNRTMLDDDIVTLWNSNLSDNYINKAGVEGFIEKNKEYEQSKEIIEEWKKVNNIKYNPEEIYSRGQEFVSVVGAYSSFDVNLIMQNLLHHIEDNEKAGGKFALSAFTKPINKTISHLEGGGGKIKFKIYPQSEDILWASNTDVYSGSVWDASEKINKDKKSELLGVAYTKYPSLRSINTVQPNLAAVIDDLAHHHNELGIVLTGNNFRLEYDDNIPHATKKIIDSVNSILDKKYGKLVKPEISKKEKSNNLVYNVNFSSAGGEISANKNFSSLKEATDYIESIKEDLIGFGVGKVIPQKIYTQSGIQPTQTNETLKEKLTDVAFRVADLYEEGDTSGGGKNYLTSFGSPEFKQKEYTSQALINTKIAALKEIGKRYPRSLIRSEVKPIYMSDGISRLEFDPDELPFQKLSKVVSINPAITQFKNEIKLKKKEVSGLQKAIINKRVALANAKLGSSYFIQYTQVGQSDNYTWEIVDKAQGQMRIAMSLEESKNSQDDKLNKILLDFLAKFGISGEQVSKIASVRGYSPLAIADFTNKLIQWTKGNEKEIPEEAAHFILGMMPRNDLFARLMKLARKSDKFNEVNEVYSEIYNDEDKIVFETAGKLLADAFNNKFEQEAESFLSRTLRLVLNWVRQLFGKAQLSSLKEELEKEFGTLARGIMEGTVTDLSTANLGQGVYYSTEEAVKKTVESLKNRKAYLSKFTGGQDAETVKIRRSKLDADIKRLEKDASEETLINLGYKHLKESEKILNKKNFTPKDLNDVQLTISRLKALPQLFKKEELVLTNEQSAKVKNLADEILNLEKLWKQKMLQVGVAEARAQGYDLTEDELMQAVADIGWFKREELSIDTSHIPIMKVIYSIITEMKRERDAEYEAYKAQSDEFRKTKNFDHLLDSKGRLITQTKSEFFEEEAKEFRKLNAYLEKYKGNKKKIYEAYTRMHNWYRDNVNYELTQEGLDLYNAAYEQRRAELINDDGTWDDENLEELNKWELDYNPNTGIAFANHTSGFVSGNNHWFTFLKQTPKKEWKNSEYDRVKDDSLYQFIIKSVKEAEEMVPHQMLIDVGNFDKVLHDMFFDLTNTDRTSFNALKKGVGDWLDNTFKTTFTADDLEGTGKDIKDELGNTIDVVNAPSKTHLKGKNLLDIVDGFYSLALTYKHKEAVSPTVRVLYELLKVQDAVEINKAGKRVKKGDSVQLKPAGLHNAVDATYYHMQSELYNQIRLDNENINPTAKEEKEFKEAIAQWEIERDLALKEGREVPPKPVLKKVSAVKAVDALIDYTRILKLGLKPSSAITNLLVGFTSNYLYAARNKEFSDKHLNKATRLLLNNVARALTGKKVSNEIGEKIANLSIKMGIQNAVMEDQFKYQDKFSQFMFSMQTSGEFLIANQLMLAMMFKQTVVNLKGETKELFDAYDKNGEWNTKEFGTQPKWTDDKYKEDGLNISEIRKFRNKFEELRKNRQGDYQSFIKGKSKVVGRVYHLFRTWLPRMVYQRFGEEQGDFKGRYKSYAAAWDKYREHPSKKFGGFLVNTLGVVLAKTVNIPILNKLGLNSLSELASEKYEMSLKEAGLSDLDIENMRENVRELQFIVYIILFTLILRSLSGDDDDKTLNYLINLNQRMYQDLTFFYVPTSTFSILRDILPVVSTLEDATEVVMQSTNFLETYESGFRKGDNKLLKEIGDVTPLWSSVNSTMSMLNSQFTGSSYKAK